MTSPLAPSAPTLADLVHAQAATEARLTQIAATLDAIAQVQTQPQPVVVKHVDMSFNSIVGFMVKWAVASVPAAIILFVGFWVAVTFLAGLLR